ncbi:MAG: TAXI family TRAP transporter solute-binding subunit [Spirochaetales bacterium]|nr:TAXI family TRAP transporter solute-binding subunit [Spirochaetales bacterium]
MKRSFPILVALTAVLAVSCATAPAAVPTPVALVTGSSAGTYYPLGRAIAGLVGAPGGGFTVEVRTTGGATANLNLLRERYADVAFAQNDLAAFAFEGSEMFRREPPAAAFVELRGVATLYDETCHILARADSGIASLADLLGRRVAVGAAGSGVEAEARAIMAAAGVGFDRIEPWYLNFYEVAESLGSGELDAVFTTVGHPSAAVADLVARFDLVLVPVDAATVASLRDSYPAFVPAVIPAGTYPGIDKDVPTVAIRAMLAVRADAPDALVRSLLAALFESGDALAAAHPRGADIQKADALLGMTIPLHPAAARWFGVEP